MASKGRKGITIASRGEAPGRGSSRLLAATFAGRPNRFIVRAHLPDGRFVCAHLGDPGRLEELLLPGAPLRLRPAPAGAVRKTRYTVSLVKASDPPGAWVSLETARANRLAEPLLVEGAVRGIPRPASLRREAAHGASRFDFRLETGKGARWWVEVKAVSLVMDGIALFPDAPTERGARHLRELAALARDGDRAAVLFVVQRHDARLVRPNSGTDPAFTRELAAAARAGVRIRAVAFRMRPGGGEIYAGPVPVRLRWPGAARRDS